MKRIKDIACISRPSANIRIKPAIMLLERYCFLNIQRYIIPISTRQTFTLAFQRVNFHLNFHKTSTLIPRGAQNKHPPAKRVVLLMRAKPYVPRARVKRVSTVCQLRRIVTCRP